MNEEYDSHPAYQDRIDRARSRADAVRDFVPTARDRFAAEALLTAIPVGWGLRGLRGLHYGIKGARRIRVGKFGTRYYDHAAKQFISRDVYRSRAGLVRTSHEVARIPDRVYKRLVGRVQARFPRTSRLYRQVKFVSDPVETIKRRHIPYYGLGVGVAYGYDRFRRFRRHLEGSDPTPSEPGVGDVSLSSASKEKQYLRSRANKNRKSISRCPPGHRWSSKARKCVPVRRNRA